MRWLRQWGPAIAWAAVIWFLSTGLGSAERTSGIILPVLRWLLPDATVETLLAMHAGARKSAHFIEYFIFSLLVLRGVRGKRSGWKLTWALTTLALVGCYAALDEVHQAFVPSRGASVWDTLIDMSGAVAAQLAACWLARREGV